MISPRAVTAFAPDAAELRASRRKSSRGFESGGVAALARGIVGTLAVFEGLERVCVGPALPEFELAGVTTLAGLRPEVVGRVEQRSCAPVALFEQRLPFFERKTRETELG